MAQEFINETFLLESKWAERLYFGVARDLPIIDYHCHLPPEKIAGDHRFRSFTELWLSGDHYKWRAMRTNGVSEELCSGRAPDREKFRAWARTVPRTLRNPLYHWTHLELANPFGIKELLNESSADRIYDAVNEKLADEAFSTLGLLRKFRVLVVCTTDDPTDSLEHHRSMSNQHSTQLGASTQMLPTWRPDRALEVDQPARFLKWLAALEACANVKVGSYQRFLEALEVRHTYFHECGCRLSDHGLEEMFAAPHSQTQVEKAFAEVLQGQVPCSSDVLALKSALLLEMARMDHRRGWVQQFHLGALRNNNTRLEKRLGPDTGFDSIGDFRQARSLSAFLDRLDSTEQLAKTILYNLNPADNEVFATMIGNFQDGTVPGKMQFGAAWWFLDQLDGMTRQLDALSNMGLLSRFVGMLTDSRSFLSYSRHEYFRRLLCNLLGAEMERGLLPQDEQLVGDLVRAVCFENARDYFDFNLPPQVHA